VAAFFKDYAEAHAKLSNLGAKFDPPEVQGKGRKSNIYALVYTIINHTFKIQFSDLKSKTANVSL